MKFHIENIFRGVSLADYEALYFDDEFNRALTAEVKLDRTVKKKEIVNGHLSRVVLIVPDREIPAPAARVLGASKLEYTEYIEYTFGSYRGTWRTVPGVLTGKITTAGTFAFAAAPGGVERTVDGEIRVDLFAVGGLVEKVVVGDIEKSYERATAFTERWIREGRVKPAAKV